jgi:hypothetical protein
MRHGNINHSGWQSIETFSFQPLRHGTWVAATIPVELGDHKSATKSQSQHGKISLCLIIGLGVATSTSSTTLTSRKDSQRAMVKSTSNPVDDLWHAHPWFTLIGKVYSGISLLRLLFVKTIPPSDWWYKKPFSDGDKGLVETAWHLSSDSVS